MDPLAAVNTVVDLFIKVWNFAAEHAGYICYEENLVTLRTDMDELKAVSNDVKSTVEAPERKNWKVRNHVGWWLSEVEHMADEVNELIPPGAGEEVQNNCLGSCYQKNCWSSYKKGKMVAEKLNRVAGLMDRRKLFESLATPPDPFDLVLNSIKEEGPAIIGVYGPGGVGKTTLLNKISNTLLSSQRQFDFVIRVVASQDLNLENIQGQIGREMGFLEDKWKRKRLEEKAAEILEALIHKKFLLLLDDLWEQVDLSSVGVPNPAREDGSKLVFATRSEEVCDQMGAEEKIEVSSFEHEEAWNLFRETVGQDTLSIHPEIPQVAESIAKMCKGLPLALTIIGRAMSRKKTIQEWNQSFEVLTKSTSESSGTDEVLALLKFSYDNLPSEKVKACFLYCTLFPEEYSINKQNLIDYWIGEGFLSESGNVYEARKEGYEFITILLDACLLKDEDRDVKMHDLIREMALWIANERGRLKGKYWVEAGSKLAEVPDLGKWEAARRMSLMANHIRSLEKPPRCPGLLTLLLASNNLKTIASSFFQFMPSLRALDLSENRELTEVPSGISRLGLLQYLNLSRTGIRELPSELKNLVKLKCLNLEHTYELHPIRWRVLSYLSNLKVLRMFYSASDRVVGDGIETGGYENFAKELQSLEHLSVLTITVRSEYALKVLMNSNRIQASIQALLLQELRFSRSLNISFLERVHCLNELEFIDCMSLSELIIDDSLIMRGRYFNGLHKVSIVNCSILEDLSWLALAPNLEFLMVSRCFKMLEIIRQGKYREENLNVLSKLKDLQLVTLPQLKSIYPDALLFPCLKKITVDGCPMLNKLPLDSVSAREQRLVIQGWEDWWKNLKWKDEATRTAFQASFKACMY